MDILSDSLQIVWRVGIKLKLFTILLTGKRYYFKRQMSNFSSKSWREQAIFWWNDIDVRYVLDQHADFDAYIASSLKQQSVSRHVGPQGRHYSDSEPTRFYSYSLVPRALRRSNKYKCYSLWFDPRSNSLEASTLTFTPPFYWNNSTRPKWCKTTAVMKSR